MLTWFNMNKLDGIIKSQKDILPYDCYKNVVYKICSRDLYCLVRQIERKLKTRITDHRNNKNKKTGNPSVITEGWLELSQNIRFHYICFKLFEIGVQLCFRRFPTDGFSDKWWSK